MSRIAARTPQDVSRLIAERAALGDVEGIAELYEPGAVMASPSGCVTVGRAAIRDAWLRRRRQGVAGEAAAPTVVRSGDIAVVSTPEPDALGQTTHVVRLQPDGAWLRVIDQPARVENLDAA